MIDLDALIQSTRGLSNQPPVNTLDANPSSIAPNIERAAIEQRLNENEELQSDRPRQTTVQSYPNVSKEYGDAFLNGHRILDSKFISGLAAAGSSLIRADQAIGYWSISVPSGNGNNSIRIFLGGQSTGTPFAEIGSGGVIKIPCTVSMDTMTIVANSGNSAAININVLLVSENPAFEIFP